MNVTRRCERLERLHSLQTKVQNIALGCIGLFVTGASGEIVLMSISQYNHHNNILEIFKHRSLWSVIIETMTGILTSALLFRGARRKNRYMLLPFMIVMVLIQAFLMITFFIFSTLCLTGQCEGLEELTGDPLIYFYLFVLFMMISITCWMFRVTKFLFNELRKDDIIEYPESNSSHLIHQIQIPDAPQSTLPELETQNQHLDPRTISFPNASETRINDTGYNSSLHVNLPISSYDNSNVDAINTGAREEPPPDYNVATAMTNAITQSMNQPPPSYEDVIKSEKS